MTQRCPVCRHPMHRTKRGSLVCLPPHAQSAVKEEAHRMQAHIGKIIEINWRWTMMITGGVASLREYTRNYDPTHDWGSKGDESEHVKTSVMRGTRRANGSNE